MHTPIALYVFWSSTTLLGYTAVGYGCAMRLLARLRPPIATPVPPKDPPFVTMIVVARNEAGCIEARIKDLLSTRHPVDRLHLVTVSDGSSDRTAELARKAGGAHITVIEVPEGRGKAHGINAALLAAQGDLIVFADARQRFTPETIPRLIDHFANPQVGAVSGSLEIDPSQSALGRGIEAYWRREKQLRAVEARWDSCIGCTGAVYAIRRSLSEPLPDDTILDDVVIPMRIALRGYRVLHDESALAYDPQPLDPHLEKARKKRTLAGNFQMLFRYPRWLSPWRNRLWLQLVSHKYLRLLTPLFLLLTFSSNALLLRRPMFAAAFLCQSTFYLCAAIGLAVPALRSPVVTLPASVVFLNTAVVRAFFVFATCRHRGVWTSGTASASFKTGDSRA